MEPNKVKPGETDDSENQDSEDITQSTPQNPAVEEVSPETTPQSVVSNKKWLWLGLGFVVIVGLVIGAWFVFSGKDSKKQDTNTTAINDNSEIKEENEPSNAFYYLTDDEEVLIINDDFTSESYIFETDLYVSGYASSLNQGVQLAGDTKAFISTPDGHGSEGTTHKIFVDNGANSKVFDMNERSIIDWLLTDNGSEIYVLSVNYDNNKDTEASISVINVSDLEIISERTFSTNNSVYRNIVELNSGEVVMYTDSNGEGSEFATKYVLSSGVASIESSEIDQPCPTVWCGLEDVEYASSDGKYLLWESMGGQDLGYFYYYLQNTENDSSLMIASFESGNDQPRIAYWSDDSQMIVYEVVQYGQDVINRQAKIVVYDVGSNVSTTIFQAETNKVNLLGWMPDNEHVVIQNENEVKIINVKTLKTTETGLSTPINIASWGSI